MIKPKIFLPITPQLEERIRLRQLEDPEAVRAAMVLSMLHNIPQFEVNLGRTAGGYQWMAKFGLN